MGKGALQVYKEDVGKGAYPGKFTNSMTVMQVQCIISSLSNTFVCLNERRGITLLFVFYIVGLCVV